MEREASKSCDNVEHKEILLWADSELVPLLIQQNKSCCVESQICFLSPSYFFIQVKPVLQSKLRGMVEDDCPIVISNLQYFVLFILAQF